MSSIFLAGNAVLDIINEVDHYPEEDEEMRVLRQRIAVGGNAANTAQMLAQQEHQVYMSAMFARDPDGQRLQQSLSDAGVDLQYAVHTSGHTPVSYITLNCANGSRTILHHRDLPELSESDLQRPDFTGFDWLHFEGRNIDTLYASLPNIRSQCIDQGFSLEIEKPRIGIERLIPLVDVVMFSASFARTQGFSDAESLLLDFHRKYPEQLLSCTWGAEGAWVIDRTGELSHYVAPVVKIVDTVGAGDIYNAGLINGLVSGFTLRESLQQAVELAAERVTQSGIS